MSYLIDLDEYPERALRHEIARREQCRANGLCDYCGRSRTLTPCRFPERHKGEVGDSWYIFVNGRRVLVTQTHLSYDQLVAIAGLQGYPSMTCHYPSTGHGCIVARGEYVRVRTDMRIDVCHTGAA